MKHILTVLILSLSINIINAQTHDNWLNYSYSQRVMDIDVDGDTIWVSTMGAGLIKYIKHNETKGEKIFYNRANSNVPDNTVYGVYCSEDGTVWMGSRRYGIGNLNNKECTIYNESNSGLPFDQLNTSVKIDKYGNAWIASSRWMAKYDGVEWKTWITGSDFSSYPIISAFDITSEGIVWLYSTDGIGKIENDEYTIVNTIGSGLTAKTGAVNIDKYDNIWIAIGGEGLYKYDGTSFINYNTTNSCLPTNVIYDMDFDTENNLWLASDELYKFTPEKCDTIDLPRDVLLLLAIKYDTSGIVWCGTLEGELLGFDGTYLTSLELSNSPLKSNYAHPVFVDNENRVWCNSRENTIRTTGSGLEQVFDKTVNAGVTDKNGAVWLAFESGDTTLLKIEDNETTVYDSLNSPFMHDGTRIGAMVVDSANFLWMGSGNGLYTFDGSDFENYNTANSTIPFNGIWDIAFDHNHNLWGGSAQGLFKFDGTTWTVWDTENSSVPTNVVNQVIVDSSNNVWFACMDEGRVVGGEYGGGLTKFDGQDMTTYNMANSGLMSNTIFGMLDDGDKLWLGTYGAGLICFDKTDQWETYDVTNSGIAEDLVQGLVKDSLGNIWMGHNYAGISVFNPDSAINPGLVAVLDSAVIVDTITSSDTVSSGIFFNENEVKNGLPSVKIYPNPVKDELFVELNVQHEKIIGANIYDTSGKLLQVIPEQDIDNDGASLHFRVQPGLATGEILILRLKTDKGKVVSGIFINGE